MLQTWQGDVSVLPGRLMDPLLHSCLLCGLVLVLRSLRTRFIETLDSTRCWRSSCFSGFLPSAKEMAFAVLLWLLILDSTRRWRSSCLPGLLPSAKQMPVAALLWLFVFFGGYAHATTFPRSRSRPQWPKPCDHDSGIMFRTIFLRFELLFEASF